MSRDVILIGDAVVPKTMPDHDVMTVYDFQDGFALCNWVLPGTTRMMKCKYPANGLKKLQRNPRRTKR